MVRRQTDITTTEVRVYKYGLVPLGQFPEEAIEELWRANNLWNSLVDIHNNHFEAIQDARCKADPLFAELVDRLNDLNEKIGAAYEAKRTARMLAGTRDATHPDLVKANNHINSLKAVRSSLYREMKPARARVDKIIDRKELQARFNEQVKLASKVENNGLYRNTVDAVAEYFRTARDRVFSSGGKLRFHRFDGTGFFAFRFRRKEANVDGMSLEEMFAGNRETNERFVFVGRDDSRKKPRLRLRATLAGSRKADRIRHEFDLIYHRPIPTDGVIQNGKIIRQRTGDRFTYHVVLTVKTPLKHLPKLQSFDAVGVDLGFRHVGDSIRVAMITPGKPDEPPREVLAPKKMISALEHMEALKSEIDEAATELGKTIRLILRASPLPDDHKKFKLWKQAAKLPTNVTLSFETAYKLSRWLLYEPDALPQKAARAIQKWWRANSRKYREIHNLRAKQLRNRKHFYRQVASEIVKLERLIVLEEINLSVFAEARDKDTKLSNKARAQRFLASPSEFRNAITNAANREGIPHISAPPQYTSKTCSACGFLNRDLTSEDEWTCPECGVVHDRDVNAALNIAERGKAYFQKISDSEPKKPGKGREGPPTSG